MSEQFPSIRHLAGYVETELNRFQHLKMAIAEVSTLLSTVEDRKQQLVGYETKITEAQMRLHEATTTFERFTADLTQKRRDLQAVFQGEQQERQKAREAFESEKAERQRQANEQVAQQHELERHVVEKQKELDGLQQRLKAAVEGALHGR